MIIFNSHGDWERCLRTGGKTYTCIFHIFKRDRKKLGNSEPVSNTLIPEKVMEYVILETIFRYMKDEKVNESSQHEFRKGKSF